MNQPWIPRCGMVLAACAILLASARPAFAQFTTLPVNFVDDPIVSSLNVPVGMACLPDGRILVVEQVSANIRLVIGTALALNDPLITVANVNTAGSEQGLLGIAVDPGWPARPYIYVQYDHAGTSTIRISRYTVAGDLTNTVDGELTINPNSRFDVLIGLPDNAGNHNGGTLRFGPDGMLYSSLGDDAAGCAAQNLTLLVGKILRLDVSTLPAGGGGPPTLAQITPADNPFVANPNANARLVWFSGLRNPFRFGIDSVTGNLVIGDVGETQWEEIDYVSTPGKSFEWPVKEGNVGGPVGSCPGADVSQYTAPIYVYSHGDGRAVVGGVIYRRPSSGPNRFPPEYEGDIFLTDYYSTWIRRLKLSGGTWTLVGGASWGFGPNAISDWLVAPDGALLYCRQFGPSGGTIRRIRYTGTASVPPSSSVDFRTPYPTPAQTSVSLDYVLAEDAPVTITIYDLTGRQVRAMTRNEPQTAGPHHALWDTRADDGRQVEPGVYFSQISVAGVTRVRRLLVVR